MDMRHISADSLQAMFDEAHEAAAAAAEAEGCTIEWEHIFRIPPMPFHPKLLEAAHDAVQAVQLRPGYLGAHRILCASLAQSEQVEEARAAMEKGRELRPGSTVQNVPTPQKNSSPVYIEAAGRIIQLMAAAGLPES